MAQGVNNAGVVTGTSYDARGNFLGFTWTNGKMTKMGTLGGAWSQGYAINSKGQVTLSRIHGERNGARIHHELRHFALKDLGTFPAVRVRSGDLESMIRAWWWADLLSATRILHLSTAVARLRIWMELFLRNPGGC